MPYPTVKPLHLYMTPRFIEGKSAKFHTSFEHSNYKKRDLEKVLEKHIKMFRNPVDWPNSFIHLNGRVDALGLSKENTTCRN